MDFLGVLVGFSVSSGVVFLASGVAFGASVASAASAASVTSTTAVLSPRSLVLTNVEVVDLPVVFLSHPHGVNDLAASSVAVGHLAAGLLVAPLLLHEQEALSSSLGARGLVLPGPSGPEVDLVGLVEPSGDRGAVGDFPLFPGL